MQLTPEQVAALAHGAGFRGDALVLAVAVAGAESGYRSDAINKNRNGSTDTGLWQINSVHGIPPDDLLNPRRNAQAARKVYTDAGSSFRPWVAFSNASYRKHLLTARRAVDAIGGDDSLADKIIGAITAPAKPAIEAAEGLASFGRVAGELIDPANWRRLGLVLAGSWLVAAGILILSRDLVMPAVEKAAAVAPGAGKVAAVAKKAAGGG